MITTIGWHYDATQWRLSAALSLEAAEILFVMLKKRCLILALNIPDLCRKPTRGKAFGAGALGVNARGHYLWNLDFKI